MKQSLFLSFVFAFLLNSASILGQEDCKGQFRTYTIGGWGTVCHGNNPGCYRDAHFAAAFPEGVTIGCVNNNLNNTLTLTSSLAVQNFLPSGGTPALLSGASIDPNGADFKNTLASQLIGVTLAIGFDAENPLFSGSTTPFGSLVIHSGPYAGMTVAGFLAFANGVIGGCIPGDLGNINETATAINQNYDGGSKDNGFLECPPICIGCGAFGFSIISDDVKCFGDHTGSITITALNGSPPYRFFLGGNLILDNSNSPSYTFSGLGSGDYLVKIIDALQNSGQNDIDIHIGEPDKLEVTISLTTAINCNEGTGTAKANPTGGTGDYSYDWSNGQKTAIATGLVAGETYTVTVTDENGCTATDSVRLREPGKLNLGVEGTDVLCNGDSTGTATATVTGGTEPYSYLWSDGQTTATAIGLAHGTYSVTIDDANHCGPITSAEVTIGEPQVLEVTIDITTEIYCFEGKGAATANATGGTVEYSYVWSNGQTTQTATDLVAGVEYTVTVTDENGCTASAPVTLTGPDLLNLEVDKTDVSCHGGSNGTATATVTGGTEPYSYLWNDSNSQTTATATGLAHGTYTVTIDDANHCGPISKEVTVGEPDVLEVTIAVCPSGGGTATANATGGTGEYTYLWTPSGQTTQTASNLVAGVEYTVTVTDKNGCKASAKVTPCRTSTTVTQGGYGAKCAGKNWGCYLQTNFASNFPSGLKIGGASRCLTFTSAAAIKAFLPSGTKARALEIGCFTNKTNAQYTNVLAGQTVTLTLNVKFFSGLGSFIYGPAPFTGKTVTELLAMANKLLNGESTTFTADQINGAIDKINNNFDGGTANLGYLYCPCDVIVINPTRTADPGVTNKLIQNASVEGVQILVYPNPIKNNSVLDIMLNYSSKVNVSIFDINGRLINTAFEGNLNIGEKQSIKINATNLKSGVYFLKITSEKDVYTKTLLIGND